MSRAAESFDEAIKDAEELLARFNDEHASPGKHDPEVLKRAGLVIALAAWETYVKDRFCEEFNLWIVGVEGSPVGKFVQARRHEDIKRFFNPNSEKTKRLFQEYFSVDITQGWKWDNYDVQSAKKTLDSISGKRGDAAHKAKTSRKSNSEPHLVRKDELDKAIRFLKGLVIASDKFKIIR